MILFFLFLLFCFPFYHDSGHGEPFFFSHAPLSSFFSSLASSFTSIRGMGNFFLLPCPVCPHWHHWHHCPHWYHWHSSQSSNLRLNSCHPVADQQDQQTISPFLSAVPSVSCCGSAAAHCLSIYHPFQVLLQFLYTSSLSGTGRVPVFQSCSAHFR